MWWSMLIGSNNLFPISALLFPPPLPPELETFFYDLCYFNARLKSSCSLRDNLK